MSSFTWIILNTSSFLHSSSDHIEIQLIFQNVPNLHNLWNVITMDGKKLPDDNYKYNQLPCNLKHAVGLISRMILHVLA